MRGSGSLLISVIISCTLTLLKYFQVANFYLTERQEKVERCLSFIFIASSIGHLVDKDHVPVLESREAYGSASLVPRPSLWCGMGMRLGSSTLLTHALSYIHARMRVKSTWLR